MYVMKIFNKDVIYEVYFREEVFDMVVFDYLNVVCIICCWEDKNYVSILMELLCKSLYNLLLNYKDGIYVLFVFILFIILNLVDIML